MITKTTQSVKYIACDGTEFETEQECASYEDNHISEIKEYVYSLRHFDVAFPMQYYASNCIAYRVKEKKDFDYLSTYFYFECNEIEEYPQYKGNTWYVCEFEDGGYGEMYTLSSIIDKWDLLIDEISENILGHGDIC